jgi:hypothetical protein
VTPVRRATQRRRPDDRRPALKRDESRALLSAAASVHRRLAERQVDGIGTLEHRIRFTGRDAIEPHAFGVDFIPKLFYVGWDVFAETFPADVVDAVFAAHANPEPLAERVRAFGTGVIHGDLRWANLGFGPERVVLLDSGASAHAPPALDFAWYLCVNGRRIDATYHELIADFSAAEGDLHDAACLDLALLAQLCGHGGLVAHELIELDAAKRKLARRARLVARRRTARSRVALAHISRRPESARPSVTSSAYSRSPPTGSPLARRVTRTLPRSRSAT